MNQKHSTILSERWILLKTELQRFRRLWWRSVASSIIKLDGVIEERKHNTVEAMACVEQCLQTCIAAQRLAIAIVMHGIRRFKVASSSIVVSSSSGSLKMNASPLGTLSRSSMVRVFCAEDPK